MVAAKAQAFSPIGRSCCARLSRYRLGNPFFFLCSVASWCCFAYSFDIVASGRDKIPMTEMTTIFSSAARSALGLASYGRFSWRIHSNHLRTVLSVSSFKTMHSRLPYLDSHNGFDHSGIICYPGVCSSRTYHRLPLGSGLGMDVSILLTDDRSWIWYNVQAKYNDSASTTRQLCGVSKAFDLSVTLSLLRLIAKCELF